MIQRSILIIGISLATIAFYSCKGDDNGNTPDLQESEKEKTFIDVSLMSGLTKIIDNFSLTVTVKCPSTSSTPITKIITNADPKIPLEKDKDCSLTFEKFERGLDSDHAEQEFIPAANTKLTLSYSTASKRIRGPNRPVHYRSLVSPNPNVYNDKYINGSSGTADNSLILYVSNPPEIDAITIEDETQPKSEVEIQLPSVDITLGFNYVATPLPIQSLRMKRSRGMGVGPTNSNQYTIWIDDREHTRWRNNCRIISAVNLTDIHNPHRVDEAYRERDRTKFTECSSIRLNTPNNWNHLKDTTHYIVLASRATNFDQNSYKIYIVNLQN